MNAISTARLRMRPMERRDLRALQSLYGDPELMRFITGRARTPLETRARLKKDLGHHRDFGFGLCIAEWRPSNEVIGRCGVEPHPGPQGLEGELAWMFARPWWGLGLATEAGAALIDYALSELDLHRVFATAHRLNSPSIRVMEKLGMTLGNEVDAEVEYEVRARPTPAVETRSTA